MSRRDRLGWPAVSVAVMLVTGCAVGPNFVRPSAPSVTGYETEPVELPAPGGADVAQRLALGAGISAQWWQLFRSPALDETVALALAGSPTLAAAQATLAQAQEVVTQARAAYYPQIDVGLSGSRQYFRSLGSTSTSGGSSRSGGSSQSGSSSQSSTTSSLTTNMFSFGPLLSYTPDFFGHNRRFVEQQTALAENQRYQLAAAYLALTANSVTQALTIAATQAQLKAAQDTVAVDQHSLDLVRIAYQAGSVARTDVLSAESQLASDRTLLPPLEQQLAVARHALAVLVGKTPGEWSPPAFELATLELPTELPVTIPSALVHDRPDILAAEAQLHAASAAVGVATAQLYPTVTLSASWTLTTVAAGGPFAAPSILSSLAGSLTQPLFHGGALRAQQRAAIDAYDAQFATYRQTVLQAFGQVADILRALQHDADLVAAESAAVASSEASLKLSQDAYTFGRGTLVQVLDAQRLYGQALVGYARAKGQRYLDTVLLFEAMGGRWQEWVEQHADRRP